MVANGANTVIGAGLAGQLVAENETTYGVAPDFTATGAPRTYEFNSETLKMTKTAVQGAGLHGAPGTLPLYARTGRRVVAAYSAAGNIIMDLPGNGLGFWLSHMLGSYGQPLASPADTGGSSGVFRQVHQPGSLQGYSFAVQKGVPSVSGVVEPFTYVGAKVHDWTIDVETGKIATLELAIDSRNELAGAGNGDPVNGTVPALAVPSYTAGMDLFHFREATLLTGGSASATGGVVSLTGAQVAGNVTKAQVKQTATLDTNRIFLGSSGFKAEQLENGYRAITGSFDIEFLDSMAMYEAFSADTTTALELSFTGPVLSGGQASLLDILIPNIKLNGDTPAIGGPGVVSTSVAWTGLDDESTTPIQIIYQSSDSVL